MPVFPKHNHVIVLFVGKVKPTERGQVAGNEENYSFADIFTRKFREV